MSRPGKDAVAYLDRFRKGIVGGVVMIDWGLVKETVFIPEGRPLRTPRITTALDRYEAKSGFALPRSFREFAMTFGAGRIQPGDWRFAVPGIPDYFDERYADPSTLT